MDRHDNEPGSSTEPDVVNAPDGGEFRVLGRAGPVEFQSAPHIAAEAGEDLLVVKAGGLFVCSGQDGDILPGLATGEGLYAHDTRYLSELGLTIGEKNPVLLSASAELGYEAFIDLTNPALTSQHSSGAPQMTLNVRRTRLVAERMHERIDIRNHWIARTETTLELSFGADFADMFEVRGVEHRLSRGQTLAPETTDRSARFGYIGQDGVFCETVVDLSPTPARIEVIGERVRAMWDLRLDPRGTARVELTVDALVDGGRVAAPAAFEQAESRATAAAESWRRGATEIEPLHRSFDRFVQASLRDVYLLRTPADSTQIVTAGVPWYVAPFGRDSLLTCYEMMLVYPSLARDTLLYLARHQATEDDPLRDAEPGKILHEVRSGELARAGLIAHTPYYGSVDATPLFVMLAAAYYRWTSDLETMAELRPGLDAALRWIDGPGDRDGDGFVEYQRRSPGGLENQGWKDSDDAVMHPDGSPAQGPIALVEVQGYVYLAKQRISEVYDALGEPDVAASLRKQANELKVAFNGAFWMPDEGTFAFALDGAKRQVRTVVSNPGHCLYCDIVDADKALAVAERLMAPDMFSGWGVRTLSSDSVAYNPMSYHNGSVWPHDNAIIAAGLKRYGFEPATEKIAGALFDAAMQSREFRLPELYCGFMRRANVPFVRYPVACRPQAWAAAVPFMLLQSMLGVSPHAPEKLLTVNKPSLPSWLGSIELRNIRLGSGRVSLAFNRSGDSTSYALLDRQGDVRVSIQA